MLVHLGLNDLMEYADWERQTWHDWFRVQGEQVLQLSAGPHGDGRFTCVGDLVRHIFAAEKRYVEWLSNRPLTDPESIPNDRIEPLFQFGRHSRNGLKEFAETLPVDEWDTPKDLQFSNIAVGTTPRKIVFHILMHEIRHWAQIATLFRLEGMACEPHDFLFSPVMGGYFRREQEKT